MIWIEVFDLVEELSEFVEDKIIVFTGIEELRAMGYNVINFTLDLDCDIEYAAISFEYIMALEKIKPIALIIHPKLEKVKNIDMEYITKILNKYNGYIYGSQNNIGFLIPIKNTSIKEFIKINIPKIIREILGCSVKPRITGYTIDLQIM